MAWKKVGSAVPDPAGPGLIPRLGSLLFGVLSLPLVVIGGWGDVRHGVGSELLPPQAYLMFGIICLIPLV